MVDSGSGTGSPPAATIAIEVVEGDALEFGADVLALKYAQEHYGVDYHVAERLGPRYPGLTAALPKVNGYRFLQSSPLIGAATVLFVGVKPLREFGYADIREFGRKVLESVSIPRQSRGL